MHRGMFSYIHEHIKSLSSQYLESLNFARPFTLTPNIRHAHSFMHSWLIHNGELFSLATLKALFLQFIILS